MGAKKRARMLMPGKTLAEVFGDEQSPIQTEFAVQCALEAYDATFAKSQALRDIFEQALRSRLRRPR